MRNGRLYANERPGLGVTADLKALKVIGEVTESTRRFQIYRRPGRIADALVACRRVPRYPFSGGGR